MKFVLCFVLNLEMHFTTLTHTKIIFVLIHSLQLVKAHYNIFLGEKETSRLLGNLVSTLFINNKYYY